MMPDLFMWMWAQIQNLFKCDDEKNIPIWSRDLENHFHGQFSCAMISGFGIIEDQSLVEAGRRATFVGVYDGHGGFEASRYVCDELYHHLRKLAIAEGTISEEIIRNAFNETEDGFLSYIRRDFACNQLIAASGSCCLVGVIWNGTLYTANLGDSRAVIGYVDAKGVIVAEQLTSEHNVNLASVRNELMAAHPTDKDIVKKTIRTWRVKGILQVSRSIGDMYLKHPDLAIGPGNRYHLDEPITVPVLRADPDIHIRQLQRKDKFIIYASDGLWNILTNEEVVEIVKKNPRLGIAKRLIVSALRKLAIFNQMELRRLMNLSEMMKTWRRDNYHDDISVVVIFIDQENADFAGGMSIRGLRGLTVSTPTPTSVTSALFYAHEMSTHGLTPSICTPTRVAASTFDF